MRRVSKKQAKSNRAVSKAKKEFLEEFLYDMDYFFCEACGESQTILDCSHIVPIGYNKFLESEKENLTLMCRSCHQKYETLSEDVKGFYCFERILKTAKKLDKTYYNKIKNKWLHSGQSTTD